MAKTIIHTAAAPPPFAGYSQAVAAQGLIFVSGQGPFTADGTLAGAMIEEQTAQCLRNIQTILQAAGSSLEKAVSATFILAEESDFAGMNAVWQQWFPSDPPARQGAKLPVRPKGMKISIALVAEA